MKSEQEFLNSMWSEISIRESEAEQKLHARKVSRQLLIKELWAYGIILALAAAGSLLTFFFKADTLIIYSAAALLFCAAYCSEKLIYSGSKEIFTDENGNYN